MKKINKDFIKAAWDEFVQWAMDHSCEDAIADFANRFSEMEEAQYNQFYDELQEFKKKHHQESLARFTEKYNLKKYNR